MAENISASVYHSQAFTIGISHVPVSRFRQEVYTTIPAGYHAVVPKGPRTSAPFAVNLQRLRKHAGLTQAEVGEAIGVGQSAVSNWETGTTKLKVMDLPKVAVALHASLD
jgi:DNA-binding XRE family transcriptional regulator